MRSSRRNAAPGVAGEYCREDRNDFRTLHGPTTAHSGRPRIVAVGRFFPRKGFDTVIEVLTTVPSAELVIAGGPPRAELDTVPEACRLLRMAAEPVVAERVSLYGPIARADMPALLRSADVVACTPWYEPFGIVPLEAVARGVPVGASAVGGMLDTVVQQGRGASRPGHPGRGDGPRSV
ncbi:glycosyltransferase [Mycobacterium sp. P7213]|uniref:glycosyltransferase n=1 Tax=Mycobacterium sp. P7213 TaxID=2478465 RepID=UPI004037D593